MSQIVLSPNAAGTAQYTIAAPGTSTNRTLTLPDETGTVYTSGSPVRTQKGVPAFSAYQSAGQAISATTYTKVSFQTEVFDTTGAFDSTTNYRFQPTTAGYYQISGAVSLPITANTGSALCIVYKNGSAEKNGSSSVGNTSIGAYSAVSALVYLNGSTDYVELFIYSTSALTITPGTQNTYFQGILIAAA